MKPENICFWDDQGEVVGGNMPVINPVGFTIDLAVHRA